MAESCGVPYDVLAWTAEWYFRPETLEAANTAVVNYHHRLPSPRRRAGDLVLLGRAAVPDQGQERHPAVPSSVVDRALREISEVLRTRRLVTLVGLARSS